MFLLEERLYQDNFNDLGRDLRGTPFGASAAKFFYDNDIKSQVTALFAQYEWQWLPAVQLTAGLRYSDESVKYDSVSNIISKTVIGVGKAINEMEKKIQSRFPNIKYIDLEIN